MVVVLEKVKKIVEIETEEIAEHETRIMDHKPLQWAVMYKHNSSVRDCYIEAVFARQNDAQNYINNCTDKEYDSGYSVVQIKPIA